MGNLRYTIDGIEHKMKVLEIDSSDDYPNNIYPISEKVNAIFTDLKELFKMWIIFAKKNNIKWWCNSGTLLGAVRHNGFIPWDNDIDIQIFYSDYKKILEIIDKNSLNFQIMKTAIGLKCNLNKKFKVFIDIFVSDYDENKSQILYCGPIINDIKAYYFCLGYKNEYIYKNELFPLKTCKFENIDVFIPNKSEIILKRIYGDDCLKVGKIFKHTVLHEYENYFPLIDISSNILDKFYYLEEKMNIPKDIRLTLLGTELSCLVSQSKLNKKDYFIKIAEYIQKLKKHIFLYYSK